MAKHEDSARCARSRPRQGTSPQYITTTFWKHVCADSLANGNNGRRQHNTQPTIKPLARQRTPKHSRRGDTLGQQYTPKHTHRKTVEPTCQKHRKEQTSKHAPSSGNWSPHTPNHLQDQTLSKHIANRLTNPPPRNILARGLTPRNPYEAISQRSPRERTYERRCTCGLTCRNRRTKSKLALHKCRK